MRIFKFFKIYFELFNNELNLIVSVDFKVKVI